jgi:hypothetical protein
MREQPWNTRRASTEHHQWYRNLADLHAITQSWMTELKSEQESHRIPRGASAEVADTLWMLEKLDEVTKMSAGSSGLEAMLDDTKPDDLLGRLERTVWAVQAWTLSSILERAKVSDRPAVLNQLEQSSWRSGKDCANARWPSVPEAVRLDLRQILLAMRDSPLSGGARAAAPLIIRALPNELQLELLSCPHESRYPEVAEVADSLCALHTHWQRGYAFAFNPKVSIEQTRPKGMRCQQRWVLAP